MVRHDELFARHFLHGAQYRRVHDAAPPQIKHELHPADIAAVGIAWQASGSFADSRRLLPRDVGTAPAHQPKDRGEPRHERIVGHVEAQRRDRDTIVGERRKIGAVACFGGPDAS